MRIPRGREEGELDRALRANEGRFTGQIIGDGRLAEIVGSGGMGEVDAAKRIDDDPPVAVKLLHPTCSRTKGESPVFF